MLAGITAVVACAPLARMRRRTLESHRVVSAVGPSCDPIPLQAQGTTRLRRFSSTRNLPREARRRVGLAGIAVPTVALLDLAGCLAASGRTKCELDGRPLATELIELTPIG